MKTIIIALIIAPALTFACADFTGTFTDGNADLTIVQTGCEALTLQYENRTESYVLDRVPREYYSDENVTSSAEAYFVQFSPIIRMTLEHTYRDGKVEKKFRRLALFQKKLLLDEIGKFRSDGYFVPEFQTRWEKK